MAEASAEQIEQVLVDEVAAILSIDSAEVAVDAPLDSLGMTSLSFVELLVVIEVAFDLELMKTDLNRDDFRTISALARRISRLK
jgi:acyl carrier protein